MDQFPIPIRPRRRSNLGRRFRTGGNPPRPMPVFQVPVARVLGRSHFSDKKTHSRENVPKPSVENLCAKKWNLLLSQILPSSILKNETGVQELVASPSPNAKDNSIYNFRSENSLIHDKIEMPKSPGMLQYNQFTFTKRFDLKRPVDPDDDLYIGKLSSHEDVKSPSPEEFNDVLGTTSSFLLAEQAVIDQTLTESPQFKKPLSVSKSVLSSCKRLELVIEEVDSDTEDELLQQTLSKLNMMTLEIENTKKIVQSIIMKKIKPRAKNENKISG